MKSLIIIASLLMTGCANLSPEQNQAFSQNMAREMRIWQEQQNLTRQMYQIVKPQTVCNTVMVYGGWRTACN